MDKILIVEDNIVIREALKKLLSDNKFKVDSVSSAEEASVYLDKNNCDLIILDINLPKMNGDEYLKELRKTSKIPVIINTSHKKIDYRIKLIKLGANDFINKSVTEFEILESINEILHENKKQESKIKAVKCMNIHVDLLSRVIQSGKGVIELTSIEFEILKLFMLNPDKVISKEELYRKIWNKPYSKSANDCINTDIKRLRNKIEIKPNKPNLIRTVYASGYHLDARFC